MTAAVSTASAPVPPHTLANKLVKKKSDVKKVVKVEEKKVEGGKARKQVSKALDIDMSTSRARNHLDKYNINSSVEEVLTQLRSLKGDKSFKLSDEAKKFVENAYKTIYEPRKAQYDASLLKNKGDNKKVKELMANKPVKNNTVEEKVEYVRKMRLRFSNNSGIVLSAALDYVLDAIAETAMVNARESGKSIIHLRHALMKGGKSLSVYPLVERLPVVQEVLSSEDAVKEEEDEGGDDAVEDDTTPNFRFYVQQKCKRVKQKLSLENETYKSVRISYDFRQKCSDIVVQLIKRLSPLIKLYVKTANMKTVDDNIIKFVLNMLMTDSGASYEKLGGFIDSRLKMYKDYKKM